MRGLALALLLAGCAAPEPLPTPPPPTPPPELLSCPRAWPLPPEPATPRTVAEVVDYARRVTTVAIQRGAALTVCTEHNAALARLIGG